MVGVLKRKTRPNGVLIKRKLSLLQLLLLMMMMMIVEDMVIYIGHGWLPSGGCELKVVVDIHGKNKDEQYGGRREEEEYLLCFSCVIMKRFSSYLWKYS